MRRNRGKLTEDGRVPEINRPQKIFVAHFAGNCQSTANPTVIGQPVSKLYV